MAMGRTILALILAVSVAAVPATATVAAPSPVAMAMAAPADASCGGCCDHSKKSGAAVCMLKCIVFAGAIFPVPTVVPAVRIDGATFPIADKVMLGHLRRPPTHPPPL